MRRMSILLPLAAMLSACAETPSARGPQSQAFVPGPQARACLAQLGSTRARFTPLPDQYYGAGCATLNTVRLASLQGEGSALAMTNLGPVSCPLANTFAAWARFGIDRAAQQILGSGLVRIETMGSYSCRNVGRSGRRSAHATANAIDVSAFVLADGRRIAVLSHWSEGTAEERRFLRAIHESACKRFNTVLGPDYDADHRNHIHVEVRDGQSDAGRPFCR